MNTIPGSVIKLTHTGTNQYVHRRQ